MQRKMREANLGYGTVEFKTRLGGQVSEQHELLYTRHAGLATLAPLCYRLFEIANTRILPRLRQLGGRRMRSAAETSDEKS